MHFSKETLKVNGLIRIPDSHVNPVDTARIVEVTNYGIQVRWNEGKPHEQKSYVSFLWLNSKYGDPPDDNLNDPIPDMC